MIEAQATAGSWREALLIYTRPRVVGMLFLGFSAGLPFLLVFSTLSAWLTDAEISRTTIGFFSWVGITYSIKVFWAPIIDRVPLPLLTRALGKRRSWMLTAQIGIALSLAGMAYLTPNTGDLTLFALLAVAMAFGSATQDVALDAYRIEAVVPEWQGAMSATYVLGYRLGILMAGAGAFFIADLQGWTAAYIVMALLMGVGMLTVMIIAEPDHSESDRSYLMEQRVVDYLERSAHLPERLRRINAWFIGAVVCPFVDFFQRNGLLALWILAFIAVYRISDITMGVMANPFYLDIGYTKTEIATIGKIFGFFMTIFGAGLGGLFVVRYGIMRPLLAGGVLVALTNLLFAWMAAIDPQQVGWLVGLAQYSTDWYAAPGAESTITAEQVVLTLVISADNLSGGFAISAFIAYLSSLTSDAYTATQYALFSSLMTLFPKFIGGFAGVVVDTAGYTSFFLYASALGIPAILLVLVLMRWANVDRGEGVAESQRHKGTAAQGA